MWFETSEGILFSSDFCCQGGINHPVTEKDISDIIIEFYAKGGFIPYGKNTNECVSKLMSLPIIIIAPMHGSVIMGEVCKNILFHIVICQ